LNFLQHNQEVVGFASFYTLPSTVMHHPTYKSIKAAYSFYNVTLNESQQQELMQDALLMAKNVIAIRSDHENH